MPLEIAVFFITLTLNCLIGFFGGIITKDDPIENLFGAITFTAVGILALALLHAAYYSINTILAVF